MWYKVRQLANGRYGVYLCSEYSEVLVKNYKTVTNNQLCSLLGGAGCFISFFGLGLMFFGAGAGLWVAITGIVLAGLGLVNFD